ncbi:MAG: ComE operon protein 1 [Microgenomates group bacterium ADurb.Bin238]|nr:MAG: ComE operon protein 1 [Microgenomates group bacterium ADurb.Bin238]
MVELALKWMRANWVLAGWLVLGLGLSLGGSWWMWSESNTTQVEIIEADDGLGTEIWVDVQGGVVRPGVYSLREGDRVKDALIAAGGLGGQADREAVAKYINLAEKIKDGTKLYIPVLGESEQENREDGQVQGLSTGRVNINTATKSELDQLWGVGEARAQTIIEGRPYQTIDEVKKVLPSNVYEQIKDMITVY